MPLTAQEVCDLAYSWTPRLFLFARQWGDSADDAVQEAFLKLYQLQMPPDDVVAWLFKATRNAAIDICRSETRRAKREKTVARTTPNWFEPNEESRLDAGTLREKVRELPMELREVLVARIWGELTFDQIAALTETPRTTIYRRYNDAIAALRISLNVDEP